MLAPPSRRARCVRLTAPSDSLIRQGVILLEDALHTASLPEVAAGRLLVIRSLAVGSIPSSQSSAHVALQVTEKLRQAAATAVSAADPAAGRAAAVVFPDDLAPYIELALRLAQGETPQAWFWPLAVSGWRPDVPRHVALRAILLDALRTAAGPVGVAVLVDTLRGHDALTPLLAALQPGDGPRLLAAFGLPAGRSPDRASTRSTPLAARWQRVVAAWTRRWGSADDRTVWLVAAALVAERPGRLQTPGLATLAHQIAQAAAAPPLPAAEAGVPPGPTPSASGDRSLPPPSASGGASGAEERSSGGASDSGGVPSTPPTHPPRPPFSAPPATSAPRRQGADPLFPVPEMGPPSRWPDAARPTDYAGLYFLLPLLARLGLPAFLQAHPQGIELDLPERCLRHVAQGLGATADDPALTPLPVADPVATLDSFTLPPAWRELAQPGDWRVRRVAGRPASRSLWDASGDLPLALWQGRPSDAVRALLAAGPLRRAPDLPPTTGLDLALGAWRLGADRWLHRYAGLGLRELVVRPGHITATRTHIDVFFDLKQADVMIRRVGLDIDPAWAPWFGRVVLFHYTDYTHL